MQCTFRTQKNKRWYNGEVALSEREATPILARAEGGDFKGRQGQSMLMGICGDGNDQGIAKIPVNVDTKIE